MLMKSDFHAGLFFLPSQVPENQPYAFIFFFTFHLAYFLYFFLYKKCGCGYALFAA